MCGRSGHHKYLVWGQRVWSDLLASSYPLNANSWDAYREFLARHDEVEAWIESIKPSLWLDTENDPKLTERGIERSLQIAIQHMSRHSQDIIRMWFRDCGSKWYQQRWREAQPMDDYTKALSWR
jgi:hypothetical protein